MSKSFYTPHDFNEINVLQQQQKQISTLGAVVAVKTTQSGDINILNATGGSVVTLPAAASGLNFKFIVANSSSNVLSAPSMSIYGGIGTSAYHTSGNLAAVGSTTITTTSGSSIGDSYSFVSDGVRYYLSGNVANFNACQFA